MAPFYYPVQTEEVDVQSVSGTTVNLASPLQYMHWGIDPESAEVG
jgi:hypothetical protein